MSRGSPGPTRRPKPRRLPRDLPHTPTPGKTLRGQRTRIKILRAAEKVFGDVGFYDARISEITRTADVAAGTFYLYFRSKEELLRALIEQINHDLRRALTEGTGHLKKRADAEVRGFEIFFYEFLPRHRKLYRIIKQAEFADPPIFEWYYYRIADGYARRLRAAMKRGEYRRWDPDLAACALMGIADFVSMRYVTWGRGLAREKLRELMDFILGGLVAGTPAPRTGSTARPRRPSPHGEAGRLQMTRPARTV
jgi:AcrR family transcriptional regulator